MTQTAAPTAPQLTAVIDDDLAETTWRRTRRLPAADWAAKPAMQQKVRELCGAGRMAPAPAAVFSVGRFESTPRVVRVGRRTAA